VGKPVSQMTTCNDGLQVVNVALRTCRGVEPIIRKQELRRQAFFSVPLA